MKMDDIKDENNQIQETDNQQLSEDNLVEEQHLKQKDEHIEKSESIENKFDENPNNLDGQEENNLDNHQKIQAVYDIPVQVSAVLGRATMPVESLLKLGRGAVVALDRKVGEAIDIYVNNLLVARGEVVVVDDHLGVTMTEIIKSIR